MISALPVTAARGRPPPRLLAVTIRSGSMASCSIANILPVRAKPVCTSSAMNRMPCLRQTSATAREPSRRRHDESAFALHRLHNHGRHRFRRHHALESVLQQRRGLAIRHAVDIARERLEACLIRMRFAGERECQQRAPVEGVFEADHRRAAGVSARDLDGVLDRLGAAVQQQRLLGRSGQAPAHSAFRQAARSFHKASP